MNGATIHGRPSAAPRARRARVIMSCLNMDGFFDCIYRASLWRISLKSLLDNLPSGIFLIPEIFLTA